MEPITREALQEAELGADIVEELERIARRLGAAAGNVTLEAVFSEGRYIRGFLKRGPINADELRTLGRTE